MHVVGKSSFGVPTSGRIRSGSIRNGAYAQTVLFVSSTSTTGVSRSRASSTSRRPDPSPRVQSFGHVAVRRGDDLDRRRDEHPAHRVVRMLYAKFVTEIPAIGTLFSRLGGVEATIPNGHALLKRGEAVGIFRRRGGAREAVPPSVLSPTVSHRGGASQHPHAGAGDPRGGDRRRGDEPGALSRRPAPPHPARTVHSDSEPLSAPRSIRIAAVATKWRIRFRTAGHADAPASPYPARPVSP